MGLGPFPILSGSLWNIAMSFGPPISQAENGIPWHVLVGYRVPRNSGGSNVGGGSRTT